MRALRVAVRGALLLLHAAAGAAAALLARGTPDDRFRLAWHRRACRILGLRVRVLGEPEPTPALYAANHVSWLDVAALGATIPADFVAKSEVAGWPAIGLLARAGGTVFLRRECGRSAARAVETLIERLACGRSVVVFPEGTSTAGRDVLPFKSALFEAPARLGCDVQPVSIRYREGASVAPFIGDDSFLPHLLRVLAEPETEVELFFGPRLCGHGRERGELARRARGFAAGRLRVSGRPLATTA